MAKIKNAQRLDGMDQSGVRKLFALAQNVTGIISLGIGQPNIPTSKGLIDILVKLIKNGDNYYSPTQGTKKFLEAIAEQNKREYNLDYNPNNEILATASGCEALYAALMSYVNPGDEVLLPNPCFLTYFKQIKLAGGIPVWLKPTEDLKINTSNLQEYVNKKTKAIILNFPSNPTGEIMSAAELKPIIDIANDNNLLILSDEVYEKCIYIEEKHVRVPALENAFERTILLNSFSKTFCVPGWRIGYIAGPKDLVAPIINMHSFIIANAPSAQQNAIGEFLNSKAAESFTNMLRKILHERMLRITKGFNSINGFSCRQPEGSFYVFPDVSAHKDYTNSKDFCERIFTKLKVVLAPGSEFGPAGEGYLRASFGSTALEEIDETVNRLKQL